MHTTWPHRALGQPNEAALEQNLLGRAPDLIRRIPVAQNVDHDFHRLQHVLPRLRGFIASWFRHLSHPLKMKNPPERNARAGAQIATLAMLALYH
jgi:hypothetical protein